MLTSLWQKHHFFIFRLSVILKAMDGALEIILGVLLFFTSYETIVRTSLYLFAEEIGEHPGWRIWDWGAGIFRDLSVHHTTFWAALFLVHGAVKLVLVAGLLRNRLWSYPAAMGAFGVFVLYQGVELSQRFSLLLASVTAFDVLLIYIIFREYLWLVQEQAS